MSGVDPSFGLNDFGKAKYKNESETIASAFLNLLFGRPGYFPSMPNLGIDIQSYIYSFWDDISEEYLKAMVSSQCSAFKQYIDDGSLDIVKSWYKDQPLLLIVVPVQINNERETLNIGITKTSTGAITYNYVFGS